MLIPTGTEARHDELKLGPLAGDKPVKISVELPASVHRDLVAYAGVNPVRPDTGLGGSSIADNAPRYPRTTGGAS
jgi:hypothetical protein